MPRRARAGAAVALVAAASLVIGAGGDGGGARAQQMATATAPNRTLSGLVSTCVRPRRARLQALTLDGRELPFRIRAADGPRCRGGTLRILRIAPLRVGGEPAFVRRGGCDRPARGTRCRPQPTAHVRAHDLAPVPLSPAERNGNGAAVGPCARVARTAPAAVGRELRAMRYKRPSELPGRSLAGATWANYGNPGRRFGEASTSYLLWNLPRMASGVLPGGGIVEAVLSHGQRVRLCDVAGLSLPSFDRHGRRNGRVRFAYAAVDEGGQTLYGWVMRGYAPRGRPLTSTVVTAP